MEASELAITRAQLIELRGGLSRPEPDGEIGTERVEDGDGDGRVCAECGQLLPSGAAAQKRYCSSGCQRRAKDARARVREAEVGDAIVSLSLSHPSMGPARDEPSLPGPEPAGVSLVELVTALVAAGLAVTLRRDGWEIAAWLAG